MSIVKLNNRGVKNATAFGSITGLGSMTFIKKLTASSSATLSFVDGSSSVVLDNTYKEYVFTFNNIHPATDNVDFNVNFRDGGSSYDATKTTTFFYAEGEESGGGQITYDSSTDLAQSTSAQTIINNIGSDNDQCGAGTLHLFNPSSTTFVKHFISRCQSIRANDRSWDNYAAGYCNVTAAIDGVQFSFSSGNIDSGVIKLYGIS